MIASNAKQILRAFLGASANLSGEPTYTRANKMIEVFGNKLPFIFAEDGAVPPPRQKSTSLVDLTQADATIIREGNVPERELRNAFKTLGIDRLHLSDTIKRL